MWNRDISGDARQQWAVIYEGTENQTNCPAGGNVGVYAFLGYNGYYAGAGYTSDGGQSYYVGDGNTSDFWAWGSDGGLYNCADTRNNPNEFLSYSIPSASWYEGAQLYTAPVGTYTPFEQVRS